MSARLQQMMSAIADRLHPPLDPEARAHLMADLQALVSEAQDEVRPRTPRPLSIPTETD